MKPFQILRLALALMAVLIAAGSAHATITVLDYWHMGENDPGAVSGGQCTNTVDAVAGHTLTNTTVNGLFPIYTNGVSVAASAETDSTLALALTNGQFGTAVMATSAVNNFGIECWVNPGTPVSGGHVLALNGIRSTGWGLYLGGANFEVLYGGKAFFDSVPAPPNVWTHLALVRSGGVAILYTNGVPAGTNFTVAPITPSGSFTVGGDAQFAAEDYTGLIDEVRVFTFAPGAFSPNDLLLNSTNVFVSNTNDAGTGSLRAAVANAPNGANIAFASNLSGQTILLTSGQIELSNNVTIDASALTNGIVINGNGTARVFDVTNATALLEALTITNGFGSDGGYYGGGGILNFGNLTLANCTLSGNSENGWIGGAIDAETGTVTVNQCTFSGNFARGSSCFGGGAIGVYTATVTVNQSTLSGNSVNNSHNGGGGIFDSQGTLVVNQCTLSGNSANSSDAGGGGIYNNDGMLVVNQSTVAGNSANNTDGGGGINDFGLGNTMLTNSIFAANTATGGQGADIFNNYVSLTFGGTNLVQAVIYNNNATINGTYLTAAANLAPLGNYGGPTPTMPPLPGSPAIDGGGATTFITDQRGFPRVVGSFADIGAVEAQLPAANPPVLKNITQSGGGDGSAFQFTFTNAPEADFTVLISTNLALPLANWTVLGEVMQPVPGQYQFTDPQATTNAVRFYRVRSP